MMGAAVQPYEALFFHAADNVDEVNEEMAKAYDDDGFVRRDVPADFVTVVAVEYDHQARNSGPFVWILRNGQLERQESWLVRTYFQ